MTIDTWIFDLDDTLYPPESGVVAAIEARMTDWIAQRLGLDRTEADRLRHTYWRDYGGTLPGLVARHGISPEAFLRDVHDIPLTDLAADPALGTALATLPGRRVVFTNGSATHAERVLMARGLTDHFHGTFSIEHADFVAKPDARAFDSAFRALDIDPTRAAMFEDSPANLRVPSSRGVRTVLVGPSAPAEPFIDHHAPDLTAFLSQVGISGFPTPP
ncbi:pyrimidine 5'-nucleotidase [Palleronia sp.]|uniref:pyrimidine 5'-nucleotidase n=1 Tax=Palleronia sp. TaxID=1940284 RepID=UPI0035C81F54